MSFPHPSIRQTVLFFSTLTGFLLFTWIYTSIPNDSLRVIRLSEYSSFLSLIFLYLSLLVSPLYTLFPYLPFKAQSYKARRAIGVTGWGYALVHAAFGFFGQLGGFAGLAFLSSNY